MSAWHQEDHPCVPSRLHVWPKVRGLSAEVITTEKTRRLFDARKKELGLEYAAEELNESILQQRAGVSD